MTQMLMDKLDLPQTAVDSDLPQSIGEKKPRSGSIQSIERAFAVLERIARAPSGASLSELSGELSLHTSTVFHIVQTMVSLGYVRQVRDTKRYRIGRPLFSLAATCVEDLELISVASPILRKLSEHTGEKAHLGVWSGNRILVLARSAVAETTQLVSTVGVLRPAYATGLGKALLAATTDSQLDCYLRETSLTPITPRTISDPDALRCSLEHVRRQGVAFDDGEFDLRVRCVADVVRNHSGKVIGAIGISGPTDRLSLPVLHSSSDSVCQANAALSETLGYRRKSVGRRSPRVS